jgi:transcriptional regulator GlxA family with amidase domain
MQSGRGSRENHATEQTGEWDALLNGHPALLRLRTWIVINDPIRLTMREAADLACVELHYFSAIFRKHTGRSFIEWRRSIRIARAAQLMAGGTLTIQQVVHAVGYKDRRSLERALKQLRNMTPGALRSRESEVSARPAHATRNPKGE